MTFQVSLFLVLVGLSTLQSAKSLGEAPFEVLPERDINAQSPPKSITGLFDPVLRVNRHSFQKNILEQNREEVTHWIVLFCPSWYEPCQALEPLYRQLTMKWEEQLNSAWLSKEVGFAAVDCAVEKTLCNTQNVGMKYPYIAHYRQGQKTAAWKGKSFETDGTRLKSFLQSRLGGAAAASNSKAETDDATAEGAREIPMDFLLIVVAIAGNAWIMSRSSCGSSSATSLKSQAECQAPLSSTTVTSESEYRYCVARSPSTADRNASTL